MSWNESGNGKDPWKGGGNQPDDLDKIEASIAFAYQRYPILERAGVKQVIHGPFTFAPDGNPLALAARKLARAPVEVVGKVQNFGGLRHPPILFGFVEPGHAQRKGDILAHAHMRVERIGLEHHGQPPVGSGNVVHHLAPDDDITARYWLQPRDHAQ